jgi:hypothetical protein
VLAQALKIDASGAFAIACPNASAPPCDRIADMRAFQLISRAYRLALDQPAENVLKVDAEFPNKTSDISAPIFKFDGSLTSGSAQRIELILELRERLNVNRKLRPFCWGLNS